MRQPAEILTTSDEPPPARGGADWAAQIVGGKQWFSNDPPKLAWVPVLSPNSEMDPEPAPVAGWVVNPIYSGSDFPFHHPFGNDWECFIEVDQQFQGLLAPNNDGTPRGQDKPSQDYVAATAAAPTAPKAGDHRGVLGVEWESGVLAPAFLPAAGDRIACWGRWIVDAGHTDFHTEIHPPLMLVGARATSQAVTQSTLISRPYLVSQMWPEGSCAAHLKAEALKALSVFGSQRIEAHPHIITEPFAGEPSMHFVVRTQEENAPAGEPLRVSYAFTARPGVTVSMEPAPPNGVAVTVTMKQAGYPPAPLPNPSSVSVDAHALAVEGGEKTLFDWIRAIALALGPIGWHFDWVLGKGILTDHYDVSGLLPSPATWMTALDVDQLPGHPVAVAQNEAQPFPVYGWVNVGWGSVPAGPLQVTVSYPATWKFIVSAVDPGTGKSVTADIYIGGKKAGTTGQQLDCPTETSRVVVNPKTGEHVIAIPVPVVIEAPGFPPQAITVKEKPPLEP